MLLSWLTFLAGIRSVKNHLTCVAVAMLLHYFLLASFLWMLAQGILYYITVVKGKSPPAKCFIITAAVLAWGLPVIPVATVSAIDVDLYRGGDLYCWMSLMPFYFAFVTPLAVIMAMNLLMYVRVMVTVWGGTLTGQGSGTYGVNARVSCFIFCVQGLGWAFAFFAVEDGRIVFQVLFILSTTFTGVILFGLNTYRHPAFKSFCQRWGFRIREALGIAGPVQDQEDDPPHLEMRDMDPR